MLSHSRRRIAAVLLAGVAALTTTLMVTAAPVTISPKVDTVYQNLLKQAAISKALASIKEDDARAFAEVKTITEIPSPPFKEEKRAAYALQRFKELGLKDAYIDKEGNVIGVRKGVKAGPTLAISAHLDTVFPTGTDVTVKEKDGKFFAPGISDNSRGVATLLAVLKAMDEQQLRTVGDVMFVANVGEEGEGDLRGIKALFRDHPSIAGFLSIDNGILEDVINQATGSHRYEIIFKGPGGHSFAAFGKVPSAIHALGRAVEKIADLQVPTDPKTTFTVGTIDGGDSVNAIASEARMKLDMRSNGMEALLALEKKALAAVDAAVAEENKRWGIDANASNRITVEKKLIGDRPAGTTAADSLIVQAEAASLQSIGRSLKKLTAASTDSNVPISLGVPSLTIGKGGEAGGAHSPGEWYINKDAWLATQNALLLTVGLVGMDGVSEPLLETRKK